MTSRSTSRTARAAVGATAAAASIVVTPATVHAETVREPQWYLDPLDIAGAHAESTGSGVTVAVVDSGVDASHPALSCRVRDGIGLSGAANDTGTADNGADVINVSMGTTGTATPEEIDAVAHALGVDQAAGTGGEYGPLGFPITGVSRPVAAAVLLAGAVLVVVLTVRSRRPAPAARTGRRPADPGVHSGHPAARRRPDPGPRIRDTAVRSEKTDGQRRQRRHPAAGARPLRGRRAERAHVHHVRR